jgi:hypothetical protein
VGGHRAEVEPVRRSHGRFAEERLDRRQVAAVECQVEAGRVENGPVAGHRVLLALLLEAARFALVSAVGVRERADEQRAGVTDARSGPVFGHGVLDGVLKREGGGPVAQELFQLEHPRDAVQPVVRREGSGDLLLPERVPPRLLELSAGDCGVHARREHVGLRIGIVELTCERGAPAAPFERRRVLASDERHERPHVISVRPQ